MSNGGDTDARPPLAIVGTGKIAQALGRALADCGWRIGAVAGRSPDRTYDAAAFIGSGAVPAPIETVAAGFDKVILAVSDDAVEIVSASLAAANMRHGCAIHTSGVKGPEALGALAAQGVACGCMHPLQTVADREQGVLALKTCHFAVSGSERAALFAETVAASIGAKTLLIDPAARPLYHCAAVLASNYVSGLFDAALTLMESAGISRDMAQEALRPLFETSARNTAAMGPVQALTGPILRGDVTTVAAHMRALADVDERIRRVYTAMGLYVTDMARRRGLHEELAADLAAALTNAHD